MNVSELYAEYRRTPRFTALATSSQFSYEKGATVLRQRLNKDITKLTRADILRFRDGMADRPGLANLSLSVLGSIMSYAEDMEYVKVSPYRRIKKLGLLKLEAWSEKDQDRISKLHGTTKRVVMLCYYTGQRFIDVVNVKWMNVLDTPDGRFILFKQQKTHEIVHIPVSGELARHLHNWRVIDNPNPDDLIINDYRREGTIREAVRRTLRRAGIKGTIHGLRATRLTKLAEAGCSVPELKAISGHRTDRMLYQYIKYVEQKKLAVSAMKRLENETGIGQEN